MARKKSDPKSQILENLDRARAKISSRLGQFINKETDARYYDRRLQKILEVMKDKCFFNGKPKKALLGADLYQKIELFMDYNNSKFSEDEIYEIIGQVFKGLYVNVVLGYLEEADYIPIPYIGKVKIKEVDRYSELHKRLIKSFYGIIKLDPDLKREIKSIHENEQINLFEDAIKETEEILQGQIH